MAARVASCGATRCDPYEPADSHAIVAQWRENAAGLPARRSRDENVWSRQEKAESMLRAAATDARLSLSGTGAQAKTKSSW